MRGNDEEEKRDPREGGSKRVERSNVHQNKKTDISQRTERTGQDLARNLKVLLATQEKFKPVLGRNCLPHRTISSRHSEEIVCHTGQIKASTQRGLLAKQEKLSLYLEGIACHTGL